MKQINVFTLPVFEFVFEEHEKVKDLYLEFFKNYPRYKKYSTRPTLLLTDANLHRDPVFVKFKNFALQCLDQVATHINLGAELKLTGMWGSRHVNHGYHHLHMHPNTLFAGVYYLHSDATNTSGTVFYNNLADYIIPKFGGVPLHCGKSINEDGTSVIHMQHETIWSEGKLIIFPAFLRHNTRENPGSLRQIIGINSMPVGKTTRNNYDRYNFPDPSTMDLYDAPYPKEYF